MGKGCCIAGGRGGGAGREGEWEGTAGASSGGGGPAGDELGEGKALLGSWPTRRRGKGGADHEVIGFSAVAIRRGRQSGTTSLGCGRRKDSAAGGRCGWEDKDGAAGGGWGWPWGVDWADSR
ncbi:hypothetical protein E2C01_061485 [Portunus trituberculatus]|uniref:Uncharacterized protein n=1 Tax=Portunus trituberculatus TaxID=210409 RepID=A0A5B7HB31_PORTR|nr:hypothetical protein [Portunus trituberculatus]